MVYQLGGTPTAARQRVCPGRPPLARRVEHLPYTAALCLPTNRLAYHPSRGNIPSQRLVCNKDDEALKPVIPDLGLHLG